MRRPINVYLVWLGVWLLLAAGCVTVKVSLFEEPAPLKEKTISGYGRDKILLMDVSGVILEGPHRILGLTKGATSPSRIKEELEKASKDDHIKAVVVKINSPGGTVTAADVILHELKAFKAAKGVPVVVCLQGLAASGGYYIAQAGDTIIAYPTCITGSIGVIAMKLNLRGLMDKVGVDDDVVKSGRWKDFWSPFRPATPQEKEMMQHIIDDFYRSFVDVVAQGRKLSLKQTLKVADGRIYTASQARDLGLVDQLGYLDDALDLARGKAGLETGAKVITYHRPGTYKPTIYSMLPDLDMVGPQFLYLWWGGGA
ncbi:MAG: signal peptide peptidase SppA [Syntrophobacterales bacterium]|jgi:protease-4|nr:signal peptide peptidase SppA [Syntrophobacterales bacterium]